MGCESLMSKIEIYDTTLRDGTQGEGITLTVEDKLKLARRLDAFGVDYIEGGWPGSNPKDAAFFEAAKAVKLKHAKVAAFGSTRRAKTTAAEDANIRKLMESGTDVVTIFGKSWDFHVKEVLRIELERNLEMIYDSVNYLVTKGRQVIFDAEHFFDGFKDNPEYALKSLEAARDAGASCLCLCDTNGGSLPSHVVKCMEIVRSRVDTPIGIHSHNDSGLAVANCIVAVECGATHVQGTINGYGERSGNANLCTIIPILELKLGLQALPPGKLKEITEIAHFGDDVANVVPDDRQPFVGRSAFAHKAGVHVDAMMKNPKTYEHIDPTLVGNTRRILVSELSGSSTIIQMAKKYGVDWDKASPEVKAVLDNVTKLEHEGYSFEGAEASFELLLKKPLGQYRKLFDLNGFRVIIEKRGLKEQPVTEATLKVTVDGKEAFVVAEGDGPVHALDSALRKALNQFYADEIKRIRLVDFKVRVVNVKAGTAAKVRVGIESTDSSESWNTVGVSTNIIEASVNALADSVEYGLLKHLDAKKERSPRKAK